MIKWVEQVAQGKSEINLNLKEKLALLQNEKSKVVILVYPIERKIASIFLSLPNEYGAMGIVGKKYEAIKDFLRWNGLKEKEWTAFLNRMGEIWAAEISQKK